MSNNNYYRIPVGDVAKQASTSVINNFAFSDEEVSLSEYPFDLSHPHLLEGIAIAICKRGKGMIKINLQEYSIETNSILILLPNSIIQVLEQNENLQLEFLFFSFDFVSDLKLIVEKEFLNTITQISYLKLSQEVIDELLEFHYFIVKQCKESTNPYREKIVKILLQALIYKILQLYEDSTIGTDNGILNRQQEILQQFIKLLYQHHQKERNSLFYANKMYLTTKYLSKVIKGMSGKSISIWINEMVIMSAKALLKSSKMTITEISEELNFASPSLFCRYFKKDTGLTPIQYRTEK